MMTKEELSELVNKGMTVEDISKELKLPMGVVRFYLIKYKLSVKDNVSKAIKKSKVSPTHSLCEVDRINMVKNSKYYDEFIALVDGLMLSDGWIEDKSVTSEYCRLAIEQREDRLEFLELVMSILDKVRIYSCISRKRKARKVKIANRYVNQNSTIILRSERHPIFNELRKRWYDTSVKPAKKIVPKDVNLSPLSLSVWYQGDGYLMNLTSGKDYTHPAIGLSTQSFTYDECKFLARKLSELYDFDVKVYEMKYKSTGKKRPVIYITGHVSVGRFLRITKPWMCKCFEYKWDLEGIMRR